MRHPDFDAPDLPLSELFTQWPELAITFLDRRMLCPGCPIAPFHAIADACLEYRLDEAAFRAELYRCGRTAGLFRDRVRSAGQGHGDP
ncbi:DUF1858 domain-containing protein [Pseudooceanicola sp. HF7]|uniref:DUF1858 domain-containing protein n=1 Tax=Pseudooceanicola sp. HF7 TaxID=2721560 RepID=UPI001431CE8A|nr:DUF1858 domain-containing protein [Pseudooceanicola sp. HF7]NIZ10061.1 DUF1858 domain-containing protein [Pseudooceanicola sp. HF7]